MWYHCRLLVYCLLFVVPCLLNDVRSLTFVVFWFVLRLFVVYCFVFVDRCVWFVVCRWWLLDRNLVCVVLCVVRCFWCLVLIMLCVCDCLRMFACGPLFVLCCVWFGVCCCCCSLHVVCCVLVVGCWLFSVGYCLMFVVSCWLVSRVWCLLFDSWPSLWCVG